MYIFDDHVGLYASDFKKMPHFSMEWEGCN